MNTNTTRIANRLRWIAEENTAVQTKTLTLMSDLPLDDADQALWREITEHIANVGSHATNALRLLQEEQAQQDQISTLFGAADEAIKNLIAYFSDVNVELIPLLLVLKRLERLNALVAPLLVTTEEARSINSAS